MKFDRDSIGKRWIPYTIATCSAAVLYLLLSHLSGIGQGLRALFRFIQPVFWGAAIAYIIDAPVVMIEKTVFRRAKNRRLARRVSILIIVVTILILVTLFAIELIPQLITSVTVLINNLGYYASSLANLLANMDIEIAGHEVDLSGVAAYGDSLLENLTTLLQDNIGRIINTSVTIGRRFINSIITCILAIYFLLDKERLRIIPARLLRRRLTPERYQRAVRFLRRCHHILIRFIIFDLLDALLVGIVNYIFMTVCRMPYAVLISVVVATANLVPTFGPITGGVIGGFILLLVDPRYVLRFVVFTLILQFIDGYVLKPKLYGDSLGISPLWVLIVIIIGGRMFGAAGVLAAIPAAAITDILFREIVVPWFEQLGPAEGHDSSLAPPAAAEAGGEQPEGDAPPGA